MIGHNEVVKYQRSYKRLSSWIVNKRKVKLVSSFSVKDEYNSNTRTIKISKRTGYEHRLYSLLHECGHVIIQDKPSYRQIFAYSNLTSGSVKKIKIDTLKEEFYAWDVGYEIAKKLKIKINREKYFSYSRRYVSTHM